jgi:hypothetical protein
MSPGTLPVRPDEKKPARGFQSAGGVHWCEI